MDIFTHAVAILVVLYASGNAVLIPFGALGAVIIDIDMAWFFIARNPSLSLLHHAGFSHSFFGATVLSAMAFGVPFALGAVGRLPGTIPEGILFPGFAATLAGAYLPLFLDWWQPRPAPPVSRDGETVRPRHDPYAPLLPDHAPCPRFPRGHLFAGTHG